MKAASIIIPMYNSEKYIGCVLHFLTRVSILYDTEIIVVNDGSTDNSRLEALKFVNQIKLVDLETNLGRSAARNIGIANASGEVLIFLDADCLPKDEDFFRLHLQFHQSNNGALNGQVIIHEEQATDYISYRHSSISCYGIHEVLPIRFATGNVSVKKSVIDLAGGFDEEQKLFEDVDMGIRLSAAGVKIFQDDRIIVYHLDKRITLPRDMKRNYIAYRDSVPKILAKNPEYKNQLPLLLLIEAIRKKPIHYFANRYLHYCIYRLCESFGRFFPRKILFRIYRFLISSAAFNGYYKYNEAFFLNLRAN
ncbi:MAG: glycosyltransferase [Thermincola sp.]|jgi:glycosyltransferase involved in cell wall biosynthesis|nr:glycosyltransferase [Thermincola sp.]MDT3703447.1 glycosyltransferase [Thermincola sp.]